MKRQLTFIIGFMICSIFIIAECMRFFHTPEKEAEETSGYHAAEKNLLSPIDLSKNEKQADTPPSSSEPQKTSSSSESSPPPAAGFSEAQIYSFLQGPKSWESRRTWSGKWGVTYYDGAKFGAFGCGLCCMANLYSSLTPYQCTPIDAYRFAKKHTGYHGGGAIDWGYMKDSLSMMGLACSLKKKPDTYQKFQEMIAEDSGTITLISSNESACYWTNNPGHYVTIFLYDKTTDKVFLADSGVPEHNRQWIPLKYIYRSLKTISSWQFLSIHDYQEKNDTWKHKKAEGSWVKPE